MPTILSSAAETYPILRISPNQTFADHDAVTIEEPLEIQLAYERHGQRINKNITVTMRTPGHDEELAAGFLFNEGIVRHPDQIESIETLSSTSSTAHPVDAIGGTKIRVSLRAGVVVDLKSQERNFYTTSSCGLCGKTSLATLQSSFEATSTPCSSTRFDATIIHRLPAALRSAQAIFDQTGGLHAAALFDEEGRLVEVREDIGRHNAVDKVIGAQFLAHRTPLSDHILFVSGRASFELTQKAAAAGIPMLAAVGAPSTLAIEFANQTGITLLGFVRDGRFNLYTGAQRIRCDSDSSQASNIISLHQAVA